MRSLQSHSFTAANGNFLSDPCVITAAVSAVSHFPLEDLYLAPREERWQPKAQQKHEWVVDLVWPAWLVAHGGAALGKMPIIMMDRVCVKESP